MSRANVWIATDAPYCGLPPAPADLPMAWNGDWRLLLALALLGAAMVLTQRRSLFALGWGALVVAFVSPLCALTVALFSARSAHHILLLTIAAPLLGAALPQWGRRVASTWSLLATLAALTLWHVPAVYALAWQSHHVYWLMQCVLMLPAVAFWARILAVLQQTHTLTANDSIGALAQIAALAGVMGLIGAVLTFAPEVLYPEHGMAPLAYGLEPLQDQQLGGLLMWVPGFVPLAVIAGAVLRHAWRSAGQGAKVAIP